MRTILSTYREAQQRKTHELRNVLERAKCLAEKAFLLENEQNERKLLLRDLEDQLWIWEEFR